MAVGTSVHERAAARSLDGLHQQTQWMEDDDFFQLSLILLAIFVPPGAVFLERGCGGAFLLSVLLTILGWIPGMVHAFYVVWKSEQRSAYLPSTYARSTLDAVREGPQQVSNLTGRQIMRRASDEEEEIRQARRKERKSEESAGSYFGP